MPKLASTQIELDGEARDRVLTLASLVRDEDLGDDGRETRPHITVRFGLHEDDPEPVRQLLAGGGPVRFALGGISLFERRDEGKSYDVVKLDVGGEDLHRLNAKLASLPNTQTHPIYQPHATIAYVKPGLGPKYAQAFASPRLSVEADRLTFTSSDRLHHSISLAGVAKLAEAPNPVLPFDQVAPAGVDGVRAAQLLQAAKDHGNRVMGMMARRAVKRLLANPRGAAYADHFFNADELAVIRKALEATTATANLLGRSRVRERSRHVQESRAGISNFAEGDAFMAFVDPPPPLPPTQALDYFQGLVPELALTPETFAPMLRRRAFTMAFKSDQFMLQRVQAIIGEALATGNLSDGPAAIDEVLTRAGVSSSNPQYCFLPGMRVEGMVLAASKAWYEGPATQIETDDGRRLAVTVNHPVLTSAGWKRAGDLREGDNLLCYGHPIEALDTRGPFHHVGQQSHAAPDGGRAVGSLATVLPPTERRTVNDKDAPPRIEDVFEAIGAQSSAGRHAQRPVGPLDFYGDAAFFPGEVDCVWTDGTLVPGGDANKRQSRDQVTLVHRLVSSASSTGETNGLLGLACDRSPHAPLATGEGFENGGLSLSRHLGPVGPHPTPPVSQLYSLGFQASDKSLGGDADVARDLVERLPGVVSTRRVVRVECIHWSGHVYDLQTETGFIVAEGIVTSNCEMVFRTNMMDSFNQGAAAELRAPDVAPLFPVWQYLGILDGRQGKDHEPHFDRFYEAGVSFPTVRGERIFNCRCSFRAVDKFEWADLLKQGKRVETSW